MMVKRNVPLPDMAPSTRNTGIAADIANLQIGESGIIAQGASAVKQACKRVLMNLAEAGKADGRIFAVWPSNSDGSAIETGHDFALVACIDEVTAAKYEEQRPGSTISLRNLNAKAAA